MPCASPPVSLTDQPTAPERSTHAATHSKPSDRLGVFLRPAGRPSTDRTDGVTHDDPQADPWRHPQADQAHPQDQPGEDQMTDRKTDLVIFFSTLADFDWFYSFSDDHRTWTKGEKTFETIRKEAHTDPIKLTMWGHWINFMNDQVAGRPAKRPELCDFGLA